MDYSADERALIWLCVCTPLERRERAALLRLAPSPAELFLRFGEFSAKLTELRGNGVYNGGSLDERSSRLEAELKDAGRKGRFFITPMSEDYPESLKAADPPLVLNGEGRRELLGRRTFCIVGSRITPPWAEEHGRRIAEALSERFAIVTGLAEGGDSAAIRGALGGGIISVLPCGLDECYPAAHASLKAEIAKRGLLLSECAPKERVRKGSFHARNRILAGLAEGVLVISAGEKSGALITADLALEYGRDVFAFPYSLGAAQGAGCNELIKKGAYLVTSEEDILSVYGIEAKPKRETALTEQESRLLSLLRGGEELHAAALAERAGMKIFEVTAVLSALELKGLAVKAGGNRYKSLA